MTITTSIASDLCCECHAEHKANWHDKWVHIDIDRERDSVRERAGNEVVLDDRWRSNAKTATWVFMWIGKATWIKAKYGKDFKTRARVCVCVSLSYVVVYVYVCIYVQEINSLGKSSESLITFQKLFENSYQSHVANGFELVCTCA